MTGNSKRRGLMLRVLAVYAALLCQISFCFSLNNEGIALLRFKDRIISDPYNALASWKHEDGNMNPCSWSGVHCSSGGEVVALELGDLCLEGTLGPELGQLRYLKSLVLCHNSFSGTVPEQIGEIKDLQVLDLGHNSFSFNRLGKVLHQGEGDNGVRRYLKGEGEPESGKKHHKKGPPPSQPPSSPPHEHSRHHSPAHGNAPIVIVPIPAAAPSSEGSRNSNKHLVLVAVVIVGSVLVLVSVISYFVCRKSKDASVWPWTRWLFGQLFFKEFITGVPNLQRSELDMACEYFSGVPKFERSKLEMACEDFTNIVGTLCDGIVYKGTLSDKDEVFAKIKNNDEVFAKKINKDEDEDADDDEDEDAHAVAIAVTSTSVKSVKGWSERLETQFRKKIDTLSKVCHQNFVNLIGYCQEEEPFTRMMVFEYAPNGTLFEHLHSEEKDSENLDWITRLRIAMGIACCLEYMHQLSPPIAQWNLQSSSIYLAEDYEAKISDFSQWNEVIAEKMGPETMKLLETPSTDPESNLYSFGMILFEMITGRCPPFSVDEVLDCFKEGRPLRETVDPTLHSFKEEDIEKLAELVKRCLSPNPEERPRMREIAARLKEITDAATPNPMPSHCGWRELLKTLNEEI